MIPCFRRSALRVVMVTGLWASHASAEQSDFQGERFRPSTTSSGILDVEWGGVGQHLQWDAALWSSYALNPLVVYDGDVRAGALVAHRVGTNQIASLALFDWIELAVDMPLVVFQTRDTASLPDALDPGELSLTGFGSIRLASKMRLLRSNEQLVDLAIIPTFTLPSPEGGSYIGENQPVFAPEVAASRAFDDGPLSGLRLAGNVGYRWRPLEREILGIAIGSELLYRAGVGFRFHDAWALPLELDATVSGTTYANRPFSSVEQSPLELLVGVKYDVIRMPGPEGFDHRVDELFPPVEEGAGDIFVVTLFGAAGAGLVRGFGTPDLRVLVGLNVGIPEDIDQDDDGVADKVDACPEAREDHDVFDDLDGCPDPDNDGDTLLDIASDADAWAGRPAPDRCPNEAEDNDGFDDADGCPDPDNDGDGVRDANDTCTGAPGPTENAGCPWPDSDGDSVLDKDDACKDLKGVIALQGCPDADNDGLTDAADRCPTLAGPRQPDEGCPDTDGDGFTDDQDQCPAAAETVNNVEDDDGCADEGPGLVTLTTEKIVLAEAVLFEKRKATLKAQSLAQLDQVATLLRHHRHLDSLRIEGHAADAADEQKTLLLSQERAESVKAYLVGKGIDAARLTALGSAAKDQQNRIDLVIAAAAAESVR